MSIKMLTNAQAHERSMERVIWPKMDWFIFTLNNWPLAQFLKSTSYSLLAYRKTANKL